MKDKLKKIKNYLIANLEDVYFFIGIILLSIFLNNVFGFIYVILLFAAIFLFKSFIKAKIKIRG